MDASRPYGVVRNWSKLTLSALRMTGVPMSLEGAGAGPTSQPIVPWTEPPVVGNNVNDGVLDLPIGRLVFA